MMSGVGGNDDRQLINCEWLDSIVKFKAHFGCQDCVCKAHFMSIGYAVIVARAIMLKRTCTERFMVAPIDYSLMTNIFV